MATQARIKDIPALKDETKFLSIVFVNNSCNNRTAFDLGMILKKY